MSTCSQPYYDYRPDAISIAEWRVRVDLAAAYRLAAQQGWDDTIYTHISARLPGRDDAFLINRFGLRFDEITASNLLAINTQGTALDPSAGQANPSGFAIHGAVHRARSDAHCVIHLHTEASMAISALECGLLPLSQYALRFWNDLAYHDYAGLAFDATEQKRLSTQLAQRSAMLLRNHGSLTCGRTVAEAYIRMDILERACRIQLSAMACNTPLHSPSEATCQLTQQQWTCDPEPEGELEWPALLRKVWQQDPNFCK